MRRTAYESAAAPTPHIAADPAEFNAVCRSKSNLPKRTDSNTALLPYLTHQLGSAHEWSGVWNGPFNVRACEPEPEQEPRAYFGNNTVLMRPNKVETAVHGCKCWLSVWTLSCPGADLGVVRVVRSNPLN